VQQFGYQHKMKTYNKKSFVLPVFVAAVAVLAACPLQAQFSYATNNGTITIIGYTGSNAVVVIPDTIIGLPVSWVESYAFFNRTNLTTVTIPESVTDIGAVTFGRCGNLTGVYFGGKAPTFGPDVFFGAHNATAYYLPGTTGWGSSFGGIPTSLWILPHPLILNSSLGVRSNQFDFTVSWATNLSVVVEASTDLNNPSWSALTTNALNNGVINFTDLQWTNYPTRFYRVRSQ
jgi:hypothetical protein